MRYGDIVSWSYTHHFNSRSKAVRAKFGIYLGKVKHSKNYQGEQLAMVHFNGNKSISKVPIDELKEIPKRLSNLIKTQKDICENF